MKIAYLLFRGLEINRHSNYWKQWRHRTVYAESVKLEGENLYIIFIRHLNGTDDCYEPYALLLFMRSSKLSVHHSRQF